MPDSESSVPPCRIERLKKRADFKAASAGRKFVTRSMVLLSLSRNDAASSSRLGFTVTKKLGNAVRRNRIRRRLKEAARRAFPAGAAACHDYVMIARDPALARPFAELVEEMRFALAKLHAGAK